MNLSRQVNPILDHFLLAAGAACWGIFFITAPMIEILAPSAIFWIPFLIIGWFRRLRERGFYAGIIYRPAIFVGIVAWAIHAPFKWDDHEILPPPPAQAPMTLIEAQNFLQTQRIPFRFPQKYESAPVQLPSSPAPLKEVLKSIESQTGLVCEIGFCGNNSTILFGSYPMGMMSFCE